MSNKFNNVKLSPPWAIFYREIEALFGQDPDIKVEYDEDEIEVKLFVEDPQKADALSKLLPTEKFFGGVCLKITVIPADVSNGDSTAKLIETAFKGNPAFKGVSSVDMFASTMNYVVFKKKVVQFYSDNLADAHGVTSTLYENIARDIFGNTQGIYYCTDTEDKLGKPLGEWP